MASTLQFLQVVCFGRTNLIPSSSFNSVPVDGPLATFQPPGVGVIFVFVQLGGVIFVFIQLGTKEVEEELTETVEEDDASQIMLWLVP